MLPPPCRADFEASVLCDSFSASEECPEMLRFQIVDLMTLNKLYGAPVMGDRGFKTVHGNLLLGRTLCYTSWGLGHMKMLWPYEVLTENRRS